jgi:alpha-L-arabinofuranosidase
MNRIKIDLDRTSGIIDRNVFGGFAEHLGRCIYGGIYEPGSPLADENGLRKDVMKSLRRLQMPLIRYPGGNFASGYRWRDGVGPQQERQARTDLAWHAVETNLFGTNEFIRFCRQLNTEPYLVVNCGDGDMREARDWVEYCNGAGDSALVNLRRRHGFAEPHHIKYWGIGNEVDGPWQIGYKTPQEYARTYTEFAKVMRWVDPGIKLIASAVSLWDGAGASDILERTQLLMEQAGDLIDYLSLHWYVGNPDDNFNEYMGVSELLEERLSAYEGLIKAVSLGRKINRPISIAVDEWNVWYRTHSRYGGIPSQNHLEEIYNLEDALVVAMNLNAFIRHAQSVKMANIAQIVNVIAPIFTSKDGQVLQTIFYPFELYSSTCGQQALDVLWQSDIFTAGKYSAVRTLDVSAALSKTNNQIAIYTVNRSVDKALETEISIASGRFSGPVQAVTINGPDIKAENTFKTPDRVRSCKNKLTVKGQSFTYEFEPHSVTALICKIS